METQSRRSQGAGKFPGEGLMKTQANRIIATSVILLTLMATICLGFAGQSAALKPLNLEQTQGEVRVVLLRAGQVVSTNNQIQFIVTYVVEIPKKGAFADLHFSSNDEIALVVKGKPVEFYGESSSSAMDFKELPRQNELIKPKAIEGREMLAQDIVFKDLKIEARKFDVKLKFSWRGNERSFDFKDVPLN
jgi:hypothetical protein